MHPQLILIDVPIVGLCWTFSVFWDLDVRYVRVAKIQDARDSTSEFQTRDQSSRVTGRWEMGRHVDRGIDACTCTDSQTTYRLQPTGELNSRARRRGEQHVPTIRVGSIVDCEIGLAGTGQAAAEYRDGESSDSSR